MIVFNAFIKIVKKYKFTIILYTVLLIAFAGFNMNNSDSSTNFTASKPDVLIINKDENVGITKNLVEYIEKNSNIVDIENNEDAINDALFYRNVNYVIYIPENYRKDVLNGLNPEIEIKNTGDYLGSFSEMMLSRYLKALNIYSQNEKDEDVLISKINNTLNKEAKIEITSKLDTNSLARATFYYNFLNYSILAGCVYLICLILSSFREEKIKKRTVISSMNYKKHNRQLLLCNGILAVVLWAFYVILSFILMKEAMFSMHGLILIVNSFVFSICALTIAFLIANLIGNKNAINGIINVVGLGSSFLCGAFVPVEWLPDTVLNIARVLPSYWYIQTNEIVKTLEVINVESLQPVFVNMGVVVGFSVLFVVVSNIVSRRKRKIA